MRFAREGYPFIAGGILLAAVAWFVASSGAGGVWMKGLAVVFTALALFCVWFFRDPVRPVPGEPGLVLAPGEGRVILVGEADEPTYMGGRCRKISIFLSVFDVHVQRAPLSGTVEHRSYKPGAYAVAWLDKASDDNEQASLGVATPHGRVLIRQIAGLVARRIVTDPVEGQAIERGERIGLIRFGSRVDVYIPPPYRPLVALGQRMVAGETVLADRPVPPPTDQPEQDGVAH
jgi:phosphatidylserine decarboxylase